MSFDKCIRWFNKDTYQDTEHSPQPRKIPEALSLLNFTILVCVQWYLIVALVCISPMTNDVEYLFTAYGPFVYLPLWNI